jgi:uncharacterized protein (TIGR03437 family)
MSVKLIRVWTGRALAALALATATAAWAGTFGKVVPIGGHASDIALDEARGVLYVANFTANRIEVMSLADYSITTSINVNPQPGALALSPDGQYLVVVHFGNFAAPNVASNALTIISLNKANARQTFALGFPPLGVAFGIDGQALVVTTTEFLALDPATGATTTVETLINVAAKTLPVPPANFPPQIVSASIAASADGLYIYGLADTFWFSYEVQTRKVAVHGYTSSPAFGPRVVSVADNGSYYTAGWGLFNNRGILMSQWANPTGQLNLGSHVIDSTAGIIYAQVPESTSQAPSSGNPLVPAPTTPAAPTTVPPVLTAYDADNLTVRERLRLAENLAGKSILNAAHDVMYAISDSGVTVLPVGSLRQSKRVTATAESLVFRGNFCDRRVATQEMTIVDPGGGNTDFQLTSTMQGISISPASGMTPATVSIRVDPNAFANQKGTVTGTIQIKSSGAVNVPADVRVAINNRDPDQRGTFVDVPGKLVDLLSDPARNRFYILRQDKNQVLVFDGTSKQQIATMRTANVPTQMAITLDRKWLLVGNDASQIANVYDLDTFEAQLPIVFQLGHYPKSLASSGNAILAAVRSAGGPNTIDRVDLYSRTAAPLPTLGVFQNSIHVNTMLVPTPNGSSIMAASADGNLMLYSASSDTFTLSRKDFSSLQGSYAASSYDQFLVDNNLLNASLVPLKKLDASTGASSGFAFVDQSAIRTTSSAATSPGVVQRVDLVQGSNIRPTRMVESPLTGTPGAMLIRTLAPLYDRSSVVALTVSGFTVLAWDYDAAVAPPRIDRLVNAADQTSPVAPGGLIMVYGGSLSPVNLATREVPLPTALGDSCLTVNGVPVPMLFVSSGQINAQLPYNVDGNSTMVLRTPGGVSDNYLFRILPAAPSVFRSGTAGPDTGLATIVRNSNNELVTPTNPIHPGDEITIFATGMGRTAPAVDAGLPAPSDPLPTTLIPPVVTLGNTALAVTYSGLAPGQIGVYQINATVPKSGLVLGMNIPLNILQGGFETSLDVRVVK